MKYETLPLEIRVSGGNKTKRSTRTFNISVEIHIYQMLMISISISIEIINIQETRSLSGRNAGEQKIDLYER